MLRKHPFASAPDLIFSALHSRPRQGQPRFAQGTQDFAVDGAAKPTAQFQGGHLAPRIGFERSLLLVVHRKETSNSFVSLILWNGSDQRRPRWIGRDPHAPSTPPAARCSTDPGRLPAARRC